MASAESAPNQPADLPAFMQLYENFIAISVHNPSASAPVSADFLTWLGLSCVSLCTEIHATIPHLRLYKHPSILAPAGASGPNPQTLRYLIGVARGASSDSAKSHNIPDEGDGGRDADDVEEEGEASLSTRLTCGLQAFLRQLRSHPLYLTHAQANRIWLNARYVTRADLGTPESLVNYSPTANTIEGETSSPSQQQQQQPRSQPPLSPAALSAIGAALRIAPEPDSPPPVIPHSSLQPTAQQSAPSIPGQEKTKLRPASDILDRLRWDESFGGPAAYSVGYRDRFDGVLELDLAKWVSEKTAEDWIPMHRVSYVKRRKDGVLMWWREGRVDRVFGSGVGNGQQQHHQQHQQ